MKTKTIMAFVVLAAGVVTSVFGNTYSISSSGSNQNKGLTTASYWVDASGNPASAAPAASSGAESHEYVVDSGRIAKGNNSGTSGKPETISASKFTVGHVGGTAGTLLSYSQYTSSPLGLNSGETVLANGLIQLQGGTGKTGKVTGSATVLAPFDTPFKIYLYNAPTIEFDVALEAEAGCGIRIYERSACTDCAKFKILGDLSKYHGSIKFDDARIAMTIGAGTGTLDMDELVFAAGTTVTVNNVTSPWKSKTATIGAGTVFNLAAKTEGDVVSVASLACDQAAIGGTIRLLVEEFEEPTVSQGGDLKLVLFKSNQGGLALENFDVDLGASALLPAFKGLKIETEGTAQSLVAVFSYSVDTAYHLTAESSNDAKNLMDADAWVRLDDTVAPCAPTDEAATNYAYVVDEGRIAKGSNNGYSGSPETISASNFTVGAVGGSAGTLITYSQYQTSPLNLNAAETVFANGTLQFQGADGRTGRVTGAATVLAPFDAPFKIYMWNAPTIEFDVALTAEAGRGILIYERSACTGCAKFKMLGDLSNYHGSIKFDDARVLYTLGAETGTLDMDELVFDAGVTVTVSNVSSPLKASKMTFGDGAVINLAATSADGKVSAARLVAGSLAVTGKPHIVIPDLPRFAGGLVLPLVTVAEGDLSTDTFDVSISCPRMDKFEGFVVLDEMDGGKTLAAKFRNPGAILILK